MDANEVKFREAIQTIVDFLCQSRVNVSTPISTPVESDKEKELVTIHTLAKMIEVKQATIRDWTKNKKIPYVKLPTGGVRFHVPTIRKWFKSGVVEPIHYGH